jgi:formyltetrahydrofolate-dependent phosphoribosylglycinamide formyltransferase
MLTKIAVFASGTGSNFINIVHKIDEYNINAKVILLISNNPNAGAVEFAKKNNINVKVVNKYRYKEEKNINKEYKLSLKENKIDLILLAGFMKKIPSDIVKIYKDKILNIHPSLLPDYGGKGFYGMNVHNAVFKSKDKFSGATVHYVNEKYDRGPILIQKKIDIQNCKNSNEIAKKVLEIEHEIFPKALKTYLNKD